MNTVSYEKLKSNDKTSIKLIADWYVSEWNISAETTVQRLSNFPADGVPFQIVMTLDKLPIATGGLYSHVGLLDREPRFNVYGPWLALVFITTGNRNRGYGTLLCEKIQAISKDLGLKEIFLFTHTAEILYKRLGWQQIERIVINDKDIAVMKKEL